MKHIRNAIILLIILQFLMRTDNLVNTCCYLNHSKNQHNTISKRKTLLLQIAKNISTKCMQNAMQ